ncbi:MAG: alpha/beta hydrolase [Alphaproteobacteria bacterium]|nr:alpha/beta hydrolase [Alphaproteobacteria bacterium]
MAKRLFRILIGAMLLWLAAQPASAAPAQAAGDPAGDWIGTLQAGGAQLHLAIHIVRTGNALSGTFDSLDQAAIGMPLASVAGEGGKLGFDVPLVGGHYAGTWDTAGAHYAGEWSQQTTRLPLVLTRGQAAAKPVVAGLDGDWDGALDLGGMGKLRLVFHVRTVSTGTSATVESPDQGSGSLPFAAIRRDGATITLEAPAVGARFEGVLSGDGKSLTGHWTQGGNSTVLVMTLRAAGAPAPAALNRPQMPKRPFPYREVEVSYDNPAGHDRLAGTLTLPPGGGPFPAALLITGSGPQDRDETLLGHKPFLVLADALTRRGIAVLRVDDRGIGASTGDFPHATTADFATDTEAGMVFLASRPEIDRRRIGLIGHSEGGLIAPMVAARNPSVAWVVMLAGPGVNGDRIIVEQQHLIAAAAGATPDQLAHNDALTRHMLDALERAPDAATAERDAKAILAAEGKGQAGDAAAATMASDWYRGFLRTDPAPALRALRVPVLALSGSLDLQVPPSDNVPALRAALAGNRDATVTELPGLNHLFQTARTGAVAEYQQIEETIAPSVLRMVGDWILAHSH